MTKRGHALRELLRLRSQPPVNGYCSAFLRDEHPCPREATIKVTRPNGSSFVLCDRHHEMWSEQMHKRPEAFITYTTERIK